MSASHGPCQYATELNEYGLPVKTCGADSVEHRPDRLYVRYVCADHRGARYVCTDAK